MRILQTGQGITLWKTEDNLYLNCLGNNKEFSIFNLIQVHSDYLKAVEHYVDLTETKIVSKDLPLDEYITTIVKYELTNTPYALQ